MVGWDCSLWGVKGAYSEEGGGIEGGLPSIRAVCLAGDGRSISTIKARSSLG